jgi:hypothetical protein
VHERPLRVADSIDQATSETIREMTSASIPFALVRDAIHVVVRRLAAMHPSPEVEDLKCHAEACLEQVHGWTQTEPTAEEKDVVTGRVLGLHLAVAKLRRSVSTGSSM